MGPCKRSEAHLHMHMHTMPSRARPPRRHVCSLDPSHPNPPLHGPPTPPRRLQVVVVGVPTKPWTVAPMDVIWGRKSLSGSLIGGVAETQEMLDFCGKVLYSEAPCPPLLTNHPRCRHLPS